MLLCSFGLGFLYFVIFFFYVHLKCIDSGNIIQTFRKLWKIATSFWGLMGTGSLICHCYMKVQNIICFVRCVIIVAKNNNNDKYVRYYGSILFKN